METSENMNVREEQNAAPRALRHR
ncbi:unnamed protein product [Ectocarpus sp. CCAP 1310/34]|nr:unnamed protein product [Ectocarpus sp. CCAP 1310/34]